MEENEIQKISKSINSDNYLINSYNNLTQLKAIHFIVLLIEILANIFFELEIVLKGFSNETTTTTSSSRGSSSRRDHGRRNIHLNFISYITSSFNKMNIITRFIILICLIIFFDGIYIFFKRKFFKLKNILITIILNVLEFLWFRLFIILFFHFFFSLPAIFLLIGCIFLAPHLYLTMNHFLCNHLYFFVPEFIEYPYDEFSSKYDLIMLYLKILLG